MKRGKATDAAALLEPYRAQLKAVDESDRTLYFVADLVWDLKRAGVSLDAMTEVFGFDVVDLPKVAERLAERGNTGMTPAEEDPRFAPWFAYLKELARHYESEPLPEAMVVLSDSMPFPAENRAFWSELPGHPDYAVTRFGKDWVSMVRTLAFATERDADRVRVDATLQDKPVNVVVLFNKKTLSTEDVLRRVAERMGFVFRETTVRRTV